MQSKTRDFLAEIEARHIPERKPKSFELYEEYSQRAIRETTRNRREIFDMAYPEHRKKLAAQVDIEVARFDHWLREARDLSADVSHYYSVSLKSLLVGHPMGVQIACLFDVVLRTREKP